MYVYVYVILNVAEQIFFSISFFHLFFFVSVLIKNFAKFHVKKSFEILKLSGNISDIVTSAKVTWLFISMYVVVERTIRATSPMSKYNRRCRKLTLWYCIRIFARWKITFNVSTDSQTLKACLWSYPSCTECFHPTFFSSHRATMPENISRVKIREKRYLQKISETKKKKIDKNTNTNRKTFRSKREGKNE